MKLKALVFIWAFLFALLLLIVFAQAGTAAPSLQSGTETPGLPPFTVAPTAGVPPAATGAATTAATATVPANAPASTPAPPASALSTFGPNDPTALIILAIVLAVALGGSIIYSWRGRS